MRLRRAASVVLTAGLACGGKVEEASPGDGGSGGGRDAPIDAGDLAGAWAALTCAPDDRGASSIEQLVLTRSGDLTLTGRRARFQYTTPDCSGTTIDAGTGNPLGKLVFSPGEAFGGVRFLRGVLTPADGPPRDVIWALPRPGRLCTIDDATPTQLPTAASVAAFFTDVADTSCFARLGRD